MDIQKIQFSDIRYTPEFSAFETRVRIHENGIAYVYPARFCAPLNAEFKRIAKGLANDARRQHRDRHAQMYMHHPIHPAEPMFWHRHAA